MATTVDDADDDASIAMLVLEYVARARISNRHAAHRHRRDLIMTCSLCEKDVFAAQYFAHMARRHHGGRRRSRASKSSSSDVPPDDRSQKPAAGTKSPRKVHREREKRLALVMSTTNSQRSGIDRPTFASLVRRLISLLPNDDDNNNNSHATATASAAADSAGATAEVDGDGNRVHTTLMSASADAATTVAAQLPPPSSAGTSDTQRGDFVDIGSGAGNVVSYVSLVYPRSFSTIHSIDLEQDSAVMKEVSEMQQRVPEHAAIRWWSTDGTSDIALDVNEDVCDRARSIADILKDASLVYCADFVFEDDAVKFYRRALARALRPGRVTHYVTFQPIGPRTLRRAKRDVWIAMPGGTTDAHLGQYVRAVMVTTARGGKDVAWGKCSVYVVRLLRELPRRMTQ